MNRSLLTLACCLSLAAAGRAQPEATLPQDIVLVQAVAPPVDQPMVETMPVYEQPVVESSGRLDIRAGVYFIQPTWDHNPAYVTLVGEQVIINDFDWGLVAAPRVWAGYTTASGFGLGFRYFAFDNAAPSVNLLNNGTAEFETHFLHNFPANAPSLNIDSHEAGDRLTISNSVELDVYDWEANQQLSLGNWAAVLGGGVRYAQLKQRYQAALRNDSFLMAGVPTSRAADQRLIVDFEGVGPTLGLELRRPVLPWFAVFGSARGSLLYGTNRQRAELVDTTTDLTTGVATTSSPVGQFTYQDTLPVTELEIGIELGVPIGAGRAFVQTSLVSQTYHNAGAPAVQQGESDLGFFGLSVLAGLVF